MLLIGGKSSTSFKKRKNKLIEIKIIFSIPVSNEKKILKKIFLAQPGIDLGSASFLRLDATVTPR